MYEDKLSGEISLETYRTLRDRYSADLAEAERVRRNQDETGAASAGNAHRMLQLLGSAGDRFKQAQAADKKNIVETVFENPNLTAKNCISLRDLSMNLQ